MSKVKQFFSSFIFIFIYLVSGAFIIARAEGYTMDFDGNFTKTGGVFFSTPVSETKLFVNEVNLYEDKHEMKLLWLPDREYTLHLQRKGFLPWKKHVQVHSGQIHNFQDIILIPDDLLFKQASSLPKVSKDQTFFIDNIYEIRQRMTDKKSFFVSRFTNPVKEVFAFGKTHVVVLAGDTVYIQDRDGQNRHVIFENAHDVVVRDFEIFIRDQNNEVFMIDFDMRGWWQKVF